MKASACSCSPSVVHCLMQPVIRPRALVSTAVVKMASSCSCCSFNQKHILTLNLKHTVKFESFYWSFWPYTGMKQKEKAFSKERHYSPHRQQ